MENKVIQNYSSEKTYKRIDSCTGCGACGCPSCNYHKVVLVRNLNLKAGTEVKWVADIKCICTIRDTIGTTEYERAYVGMNCINFPCHPLVTPKQCGYSWVEITP